MTEYTVEVSTPCGVEVHTILASNARTARQSAADFSDAPVSKARIVKRRTDPVTLQRRVAFGNSDERP